MDIKNLHLLVSHFTALAFVLFISLQVRAEPLQLEDSIWVVTIIHLIQTCDTKTHLLNHHISKNTSNTSFCIHQEVQVSLTSKFIEVVPNVVGLVIVPSILVVNELYISWEEKQHCLNRDTPSRHKMIMLSFPFIYLECLSFLCLYTNFFPVRLDWLASAPNFRQEVRVCILSKVRLLEISAQKMK